MSSAAAFAPATTVVVRNPVSGRAGGRRQARKLLAELVARGYRILETTAPGHAPELVRSAVAEGATALIVVGGDGTLFECLADWPAERPFGMFPTGTVNLFARGLELPRKPAAFLDMLDHGRLREVWLPRCNDRLFSSVASCGYDSLVVKEVNPRLKRWIHEGAYAWRAFSGYWRYRPPELRAWLDGEPWDGPLLGVLVGNVPFFGGPQRIFPQADPSRPDLEVCVLEGPQRILLWKYVWGMLSGQLPRMRGAVYRTCSTLRIEADPPLAVELDGDHFGDTPVSFEIDPTPRGVLVPAAG